MGLDWCQSTCEGKVESECSFSFQIISNYETGGCAPPNPPLLALPSPSPDICTYTFSKMQAPRRHANPTVRPPRGACWMTLTPAVCRLFELNAFHPGLVFVLTLKIVLKVKMAKVCWHQSLLKYLK